MEQIKILERYPYLIPRNRNYSLYEGFIYVQEQKFNIKLNVPLYPKLNDISIEIKNEEIISDIQLDELDSTASLYDYLQKLEEKLILQVSKSTRNNTKLNLNLKFIKDCQSLVMNYNVKLHINSDMSEVLIKDCDHYLKVHILGGLYTIHQHSLPELTEDGNCKGFEDSVSLDTLYLNFMHNLRSLESFYADLEEIDLVCCVIDPQNPTTKHSHRQILLGDNTSMIIKLSPWKYGGLPQISFIGPERLTEKFIDRYSRNLQNWNEEVNLFRNLLSLLEILYFPSKPNENNDAANDKEEALTTHGECCICYTSHLKGELANIICENECCGQHFHAECLCEWLSSLVNSNRSSNFIRGDCPNCNQIIVCPVSYDKLN